MLPVFLKIMKRADATTPAVPGNSSRNEKTGLWGVVVLLILVLVRAWVA